LLFQAVTAVTNFGLTDFPVLCSPTGKARDEGPLRCRHGMPDMDHSRLGGASWRSSHVRNAPLATVGPKKAACRDGPTAEVITREICGYLRRLAHLPRHSYDACRLCLGSKSSIGLKIMLEIASSRQGACNGGWEALTENQQSHAAYAAKLGEACGRLER